MTRAHLIRTLTALGASLDTSCANREDYILDAPPGSVWIANGAHCYVVPFGNSAGQTWRREALKDAAAVIAMGVKPCEDLDCDICAETKENV